MYQSDIELHFAAPTLYTCIVHDCSTWPSTSRRDLIGWGLLTAARRRRTWRLDLHSASATGVTSTAIALATLADRLPKQGVLIGWDLSRILDADLPLVAAQVPGEVADLLDWRIGLAKQVTLVDLAPPSRDPTFFIEHAARRGIVFDDPGDEHRLGAWQRGDADLVERAIADEALATWRYFLAQAPGPVGTARVATAAFMAERGR